MQNGEQPEKLSDTRPKKKERLSKLGIVAPLAATLSIIPAAETQKSPFDIVTIQPSQRTHQMPADVKAFAAAEERFTAGLLGKNWMEKERTKTTEFIRSQRGEIILESGTDEELENMLLSLSGVLQEEVTNSAFDPVKKHFSSSFPTFEMHSHGSNEFRLLGDAANWRIFTIPTHGNAFKVTPREVMTNRHIATDNSQMLLGPMNLPATNTVFDGTSQNLDISIVKLTDAQAKYLSKAPVLTFTDKTRKDLIGMFVVVAGVDEDSMSLPDRTKRIASLMIPNNSHLNSFLMRRYRQYPHPFQIPNEQWEQYVNTCIILLHPGTWMYLEYEKNQHMQEAPGVSGSPGFLQDGSVAGVIQARIPLKIGGAWPAIGFIESAPDILSALPKELREKMTLRTGK